MMMNKVEVRPNKPRDGRHCDLCGCSQPAVRCDKCGCQIFCLSCDDMYHRHPKRRFHLRKAVDPAPPTSQARPVLPMKVANLAMSPGDPSKMPLPPPRKKKPAKSFFDTFRRGSPSSDNSPPLPKKEYSWTDRLGSIKKFMSNRPLPPLPNNNNSEESHTDLTGQPQRHDLSFIHKRVDEKPPQLPQRTYKPQEFSGGNDEKENQPRRYQGHNGEEARNGTIHGPQMLRNGGFNGPEDNQWSNRGMENQSHHQRNTFDRQNYPGFMQHAGPGYPPGFSQTMHQSASATDLQNLPGMDGLPGPGMPPHYPHYPMNGPLPPHYPYPMYPQYPNYPPYFGNSFANLSGHPPTDNDFSDHSEASSRHQPGKRYPFRKRAKRSQSVMMDKMGFPGQYYPFGAYPPGYAPPPWGPPFQMDTPPSPASSIRSLNRIGRTRRRKKMTSDDDEEEFSVSSSPLSRPKSSSSERPTQSMRKAPLAAQTTSSEESEDERENNRSRGGRNSRKNSDNRNVPSPAARSPQVSKKKPSKLKKREISHHSDPEEPEPVQTRVEKRPVKDSSADQNEQAPSTSNVAPSRDWYCKHCTYLNPSGNRICQVCCKTATPAEEMSAASSRPTSSGSRKQSLSSEKSCSSPERKVEEEQEEVNAKRDKQDMENLNSALDEAEKEISRGLEELMKLKDDFTAQHQSPKKDSLLSQKPPAGKDSAENTKPTYKSSGKLRTNILDKLNFTVSDPSTKSTSTETQTGRSPDRTADRIIEATRRASTSSTTSDAYNSPVAQSPELGQTANRQDNAKKDSSCQTQQDALIDYLERKKEEDSYFGRPTNGFGYRYGDRMDVVTSPGPSMYDRGYGGGFGMMPRSHSRASLFTGRLNDPGPLDYGLGPSPMYRSVSRSSLTGDFSENRLSDFHNLRKPDFYLSMEELVERRRQEQIRAQGLELVRMIREAEQQGFTADDIQVALSKCGKQNPVEWLHENWNNMVENVINLATNYGNDKKENDIGAVSESEARDALRMHKGNIWAAVTECVESRQRKFFELNARGKFSPKAVTEALTAAQGDVGIAYTKLTKSPSKPFLMRIWGAGEGAENQDGAVMPIGNKSFKNPEELYKRQGSYEYDALSDDIWSEDEDVEWEEDAEEEDEQEQGDLDDLQTCHDDLATDVLTPESDKSDYCDAFGTNSLDRVASLPSDEEFAIISDAQTDKKRSGLLSKIAALRRDEKRGSSKISEEEAPKNEQSSDLQEPSTAKAYTPLNIIKSTITAIRDTVSGPSKSEKKLPCAAPERRTIIVRDQISPNVLGDKRDSSSPVALTSVKPISDINSDLLTKTKNIEQSSEVPQRKQADPFKEDSALRETKHSSRTSSTEKIPKTSTEPTFNLTESAPSSSKAKETQIVSPSNPNANSTNSQMYVKNDTPQSENSENDKHTSDSGREYDPKLDAFKKVNIENLKGKTEISKGDKYSRIKEKRTAFVVDSRTDIDTTKPGENVPIISVKETEEYNYERNNVFQPENERIAATSKEEVKVVHLLKKDSDKIEEDSSNLSSKISAEKLVLRKIYPIVSKEISTDDMSNLIETSLAHTTPETAKMHNIPDQTESIKYIDSSEITEEIATTNIFPKKQLETIVKIESDENYKSLSNETSILPKNISTSTKHEPHSSILTDSVEVETKLENKTNLIDENEFKKFTSGASEEGKSLGIQDFLEERSSRDFKEQLLMEENSSVKSDELPDVTDGNVESDKQKTRKLLPNLKENGEILSSKVRENSESEYLKQSPVNSKINLPASSSRVKPIKNKLTSATSGDKLTDDTLSSTSLTSPTSQSIDDLENKVNTVSRELKSDVNVNSLSSASSAENIHFKMPLSVHQVQKTNYEETLEYSQSKNNNLGQLSPHTGDLAEEQESGHNDNEKLPANISLISPDLINKNEIQSDLENTNKTSVDSEVNKTINKSTTSNNHGLQVTSLFQDSESESMLNMKPVSVKENLNSDEISNFSQNCETMLDKVETSSKNTTYDLPNSSKTKNVVLENTSIIQSQVETSVPEIEARTEIKSSEGHQEKVLPSTAVSGPSNLHPLKDRSVPDTPYQKEKEPSPEHHISVSQMVTSDKSGPVTDTDSISPNNTRSESNDEQIAANEPVNSQLVSADISCEEYLSSGTSEQESGGNKSRLVSSEQSELLKKKRGALKKAASTISHKTVDTEAFAQAGAQSESSLVRPLSLDSSSTREKHEIVASGSSRIPEDHEAEVDVAEPTSGQSVPHSDIMTESKNEQVEENEVNIAMENPSGDAPSRAVLGQVLSEAEPNAEATVNKEVTKTHGILKKTPSAESHTPNKVSFSSSDIEVHKDVKLQSELLSSDKTSNDETSDILDSQDDDSSSSSDLSSGSSRRLSITPPSPVDALRSRFEGLMDGGSTVVRPHSPLRRMSFNSRKAAIALERFKDSSTDKSWLIQKTKYEPSKATVKRTLKQQLEVERKVRKMVSDRKCRTYKKAEIVIQLMDMNFEEEEAIQAANECSTLEQAISYLQQECLLCTGHFPVSHIISMVHCPHKACKECIRAYFTVQIRDRNIMELLCPFCNEPDLTDEDIAQDYFNHLDIMLKKLVDEDIHELFQRKLRDRVLMRDPCFRWCSKCSSGFIAMPNLKRLVCPDCNAVTCASCRRPWEKEHQGISCEAFATWKDATDPEAQAAGLAKLLTEDGIDCPMCHFRYALAKGGCMHFRCIQCQHDFCSGCSRPFKMGQKCGVSEFCAKLGLHAHHPRNCLFYLRDKEPEDLQRLLDLSDVKYDRDPPDGMEVKSTCQVMEQKETADGMVDDYCGKEVEKGFAGLCRIHYVEYLGQLVNKHKVDPIQIFENDDLELVLRRANIRLPPKRYRETDAQYREKLVNLIQEELPLDKMDGS